MLEILCKVQFQAWIGLGDFFLAATQKKPDSHLSACTGADKDAGWMGLWRFYGSAWPGTSVLEGSKLCRFQGK